MLWRQGSRRVAERSVVVQIGDVLQPTCVPELAVARAVRARTSVADEIRSEYESSVDMVWARLIDLEPKLGRCSLQTVRAIATGETPVERASALRAVLGGSLVEARTSHEQLAGDLATLEAAATRLDSSRTSVLRAMGLERASSTLASSFAALAQTDTPDAKQFYFLDFTGRWPSGVVATVRPEPLAFGLDARWEHQQVGFEWLASLLSRTFDIESEGFFVGQGHAFGQSTHLEVDGVRRRYWNLGETEGAPVWCSMMGNFVVGSPTGRWLHQCLGTVR